jgi:hypothetical protein
MTHVTPMTMPSIVSAERIVFPEDRAQAHLDDVRRAGQSRSSWAVPPAACGVRGAARTCATFSSATILPVA